jgi:DNA-binding CsgD family transcriptional regulator/catechol 2,3-dioxygenase-like lactoylglutathione lyase family enzyme
MAELGRGRPPHSDQLTPAEWTVVEGVRHGLTNRQIAARRSVSLDAVKFHVGNVLGKLGLDDRRQLQRWPGVRRGSALEGKDRSMSEDTGLEALGQVSRSVADIADSELWYRDVLGLPHLFTFGELAFFDCGGVRLYLQQGEVKPESVLYFRVADIRAAAEALADKGVEFVSAPHMIHRHQDGTEEWMAFFNDLEGRPLALMARVGAE